jgi:hypothetical protein
MVIVMVMIRVRVRGLGGSIIRVCVRVTVGG